MGLGLLSLSFSFFAVITLPESSYFAKKVCKAHNSVETERTGADVRLRRSGLYKIILPSMVVDGIMQPYMKYLLHRFSFVAVLTVITVAVSRCFVVGRKSAPF